MNSLDDDGEGTVPFDDPPPGERPHPPDIPTAPSVGLGEEDQGTSTSIDSSSSDGSGPSAADLSSIHPDTLRAFIECVIYANVALLLASLGLLVWYFPGWQQIGAVLFVVGLLAGIRTYQTYRAWDRDRTARTTAADSPSTDSSVDESTEMPADDDDHSNAPPSS